jgi:small-conductance mechanosensitive channel/nucleotide-binding universal stress UspA family protein
VRKLVEILWDIIDLTASVAGLPPIWRIILALLVMVIAVLLAKNLSRYLPYYLTAIFTDLDKRSREKFGKTPEKAEKRQRRELSSLLRTVNYEVRRFVWWTIILIFAFISLTALGYSIYTEFSIRGYPFTIWMILYFFIIVIIFFLFVKTVLSPITRLVLQALFGRGVTKWTIAKEHEKLEASMSALFILIGIYVGINASFPNTQDLPYYWGLNIFFGVAGIIIGVAFATRLFLFVFRVNYTIPRKMDIHAANAMENMMKILSVLITIGLVMSFFRIDPYSIFGALAFIGFALAFGMQDSVANIMAGFMLAADKPFIIGDRVRIGEIGRETWGDIVKIGLNTTRIRTVEGELVVIPNSYIAKNEIWNYTRESPVIVHKINLGISYGSDWRLAKKIMLEVARAHPRILKRPQPFVRLDNFAEFSINIEMWVWLKHALDRDQVRSDLLESIKDRFDSEGVEIPFPYRTIVYKKDIRPEEKLIDLESFQNVRRYPSHGNEYFELGEWYKTGPQEQPAAQEEGSRILVTVSNPATAEKVANYSMDFAKKVDGRIIALYVMPDYSRPREEEGLSILDTFQSLGKAENILVGTIMEIGDIVEKILSYSRDNNIDFIIIGKSPKSSSFLWGRENIEQEVKARSSVPVVTVED